ncbi:MAG TPA: hypothetical protein VN903_12955 [Polyangia bacterium]|nr:hypothetical protein [Polyangia bacterium]
MSAQPDDLTVTTATMSAEEIRESLGEPAKPDVSPEQEADDPSKPDSALSEAGRTLRMSRGDARKAKLQAEIEELARKRTQARLDYEREELERAQHRESPPPAKPAAPPPSAAPAPAPDKFVFPDFDAWQTAGHAEGTYEDYNDARADARWEWNKQKDAQAAQHRERVRLDGERKVAWEKAHEEFRKDHADFDAVLEATVVPVTPVTNVSPDGSPSPLYQMIRASGERAPQILYYLGKHPEEVQILANAPNPPALVYAYAQMEMRATGAVTASPPSRPMPVPPPAPAQPITAASAPLTPISGTAQHARSLQSIAEDDDADAYIAARRAELRRTG